MPSKTPFGPADNCLCVGAANVDTRCQLGAASVAGTSNPATISHMAGGAGLNTARILARLGCKTFFCGLAGEDEAGNLVKKALDDAGIESDLIVLPGHSSGHYISILEPDGSLTIAVNDMAIHNQFSADIIESRFGGEKYRNVAALFCDANIPSPAIRRIFGLFPAALKCATTVSPAKADRLSASFEDIDMLFTNVAEASALLKRVDGNAREMAQQLAALVARGIISDGKNPLCYWAAGEIEFLEIEPVAGIVDVTGAGDALAAGTIAAIVQGRRFPEAVQKGVDAARSVLISSGPYGD